MGYEKLEKTDTARVAIWMAVMVSRKIYGVKAADRVLIIYVAMGILILLRWKKKHIQRNILLWMLCFVLGSFLLLLLFENRSRYIFLYLPVLLIALESKNTLKSDLMPHEGRFC